MNLKKDIGLIHEINSKGERRVVPQDFKSDADDDFKPDLDWYLQNGYTQIENVKRELDQIAKEHSKI